MISYSFFRSGYRKYAFFKTWLLGVLGLKDVDFIYKVRVVGFSVVNVLRTVEVRF